MLRLWLVPSPNVSKLYFVNLATLLLTHCSEPWAIDASALLLMRGARLSQLERDHLVTGQRSSAPDRMSHFSVRPSGHVLLLARGVCCSSGGVWAVVAIQSCFPQRKASVCRLDKVPSDKWAAMVCILRPWRAWEEANAGDFLNCCVIGLNLKWWFRRGKWFCISFIPWVLCSACIFSVSWTASLVFSLREKTVFSVVAGHRPL